MPGPGRPQLPVGAAGTITIREVRPGVFRARCRVRDADGVVREATATGASKNAARTKLQGALSERRGGQAAGKVTGETRVSEVGDRWLAQLAAQVEAGSKAPRTVETYESAWRLHVAPGLGALRLREADTQACEEWLTALRRRVGPSMCSTSRAVLSGVLGLAARLGAIPTNPVRDLSPIPGAGKRARKPRAMTAQERADWLAWISRRPRCRRRGGRRTRPGARSW